MLSAISLCLEDLLKAAPSQHFLSGHRALSSFFFGARTLIRQSFILSDFGVYFLS
jgi:hypothetical protein